MLKYQVVIAYTASIEYEVEAEGEAEAIEQAKAIELPDDEFRRRVMESIEFSGAMVIGWLPVPEESFD